MNLRLATPEDAEAIAKVHVASWDATFGVLMPELVKARGDQYAKRLSKWREMLTKNETFIYVATDCADKIVGFGQGGAVDEAWNLSSKYAGEIHRLYVAPGHQGHGIGKQLVHQIAIHLKEQGMQSIVVAAWSINEPARAFYQHLGGEYVKDVPQEWQGYDKSQTVYAWEDIDTLIEATKP